MVSGAEARASIGLSHAWFQTKCEQTEFWLRGAERVARDKAFGPSDARIRCSHQHYQSHPNADASVLPRP